MENLSADLFKRAFDRAHKTECHIACCEACHMGDEEELLAPYISQTAMDWLKSEHQKIKQAGFPIDYLVRHSIEEMAVFEQFDVPDHLMEKFLADHIHMRKKKGVPISIESM